MEPDFGKLIREKYQEALKLRGRVNLVIAGRSGVGKSTLINVVFQGRLAETGQGRPITQDIRAYTKEGVPLTLFDTKGLEMERYEETLADLRRLVEDCRAKTDPNEHLHVAWVCVSEESRRVEQGETRVAELLATAGIPVVAVITKARSDQGFREKVRELMPTARQVLSVRALGETDDEGHVLQPRGLAELVTATMELVPEGQKNAFAAAQRVSLQAKRNRAHTVVASAAATAAAIGATPIPFADAALLVPLQIGMLAGVTAVWGLPLEEGFLSTVVSSAATSVGATFAGRSLVAALLKLAPGAGSVAGGVVMGATAATMTVVFGEAYMAALSAIFERNPDAAPTADEIARAFDTELRKRRGLSNSGGAPRNERGARQRG